MKPLITEPEFWQKNLPWADGVRVIEVSPSGLLVVEKPAAVMSHPNTEAADPTALLAAPYRFDDEGYDGLSEGAAAKRVWLLNRLDSATSGLLLMAVDEGVSAVVRELFARHRVEKTYFAVVKGNPPPLPDVWVDRLKRRPAAKGRSAGPLRVQAGGELLAKTKQKCIRTDRNGMNLSLMQLTPFTGRTHQLRVQCSMRGSPILGDRTYGDFKLNRQIAKIVGEKRLYLHSGRIKLDFSYLGQYFKIECESPVPDVFSEIIRPNNDLLKASPAFALPALRATKPGLPGQQGVGLHGSRRKGQNRRNGRG